MASPAQIAANRRNATHSTGPRSATGKARSRGNALKHGLRAPLDRNASIVEEIEALMTDIARLVKKPREAVRHIAEQQIKIMRVQQTRTDIINRYLERLARDDPEGFDSQARVAMAIAAAIPEIAALEDYERRESSKLRKALTILSDTTEA
jgi:plasmid stabilization system protein ParE